MDFDFPLSKKQVDEIRKNTPTPFYLYDERRIRENCRRVYKAFSWDGYKNFFAVKALPNPFVLKILASEGMGADCSSLPELLLAEAAGITGENIMFSSNDTAPEEYVKAKALGAIINLDDFSDIDYLEKLTGLPEVLCFRYNPGSMKGGNSIIGRPEESKYGFTREQLIEGYRIVKAKGVKRFGLHTTVVSNELNEDYHVETARMLFEVAAEIKLKTGVSLEFINLGGGYGVPYKPDDKQVDLDKVSRGIHDAYNQFLVVNGLKPKLCMESGRMVTGPYGWLVAKVRHMKHIYRDYVGLDACMADLMRPGIYDAYHHITVLGKEALPKNHKYDVTGSLCENNDKFAINRLLPEIQVGDLLVIHTTGAHGHSMGFNYNGKLRHAELLLRQDGQVVQIRRPETVEDYFITLDLSKLDSFKP